MTTQTNRGSLADEGQRQALSMSTIAPDSSNTEETVAADVPDTLPDQPFAEGAKDAIDPDLRHRLISETAYWHYVEPNYADGYDLDDWLQAEAEVDHLLLNPRPAEGQRHAT